MNEMVDLPGDITVDPHEIAALSSDGERTRIHLKHNLNVLIVKAPYAEVLNTLLEDDSE